MSDVVIPDGSASVGSVSTDGAEAEVLVCSTPATGASFSVCSKLGLIGSK